MSDAPEKGQETAEERRGQLHDLEGWLETPMLVLSFVWLVLVGVELVWGGSDSLEVFGTAIWVIFIVEFLVRFTLAPEKLAFLRQTGSPPLH